MTQVCLINDLDVWVDKGIAQWSGIPVLSQFDLSDECRAWLNENIRPSGWWWDHFIEEHEVVMFFIDRNDAMRFKLAWL